MALSYNSTPTAASTGKPVLLTLVTCSKFSISLLPLLNLKIHTAHPSQEQGMISEAPMPAPATITLGLQRITSLLHHLSSPHLRIPIVHIAGTNGKGSICAFLSSILRSSSYTVGRFTSPHLVEPRDSIVVNGLPVGKDEYELRKGEVEQADRDHGIDASPFEQLTATAFLLFAKRQPPLDLAVIEVGMGGLGDATNVCESGNTLAIGISPIELDHQAFLGDTVGEIAKVKAGIMKPRVPVVVGRQAHAAADGVVKDVAESLKADVFFAAGLEELSPQSTSPTEARPIPLHPIRSTSQHRSSFPQTISTTLPLLGPFQSSNASTAALLATTLASHPHPLSLLPSLKHQVTTQTIATGLGETKWAGRAQWLQVPMSEGREVKVLLDGAHNPSSAAALQAYLSSLPPKPTTLIIAMSSPRQPLSLLQLLLAPSGSPHPIRLIATTFTQPEGMPWVRPLPAADILVAGESMEGVEVRGEVGSVEEGVAMAMKEARGTEQEQERIVVCGSLYLVADAVRWARSKGVEV